MKSLARTCVDLRRNLPVDDSKSIVSHHDSCKQQVIKNSVKTIKKYSKTKPKYLLKPYKTLQNHEASLFFQRLPSHDPIHKGSQGALRPFSMRSRKNLGKAWEVTGPTVGGLQSALTMESKVTPIKASVVKACNTSTTHIVMKAPGPQKSWRVNGWSETLKKSIF